DQFQLTCQLLGSLGTSAERARDHAAETTKLLTCNGVIGVTFEPGIEHLLHDGMSLEKASQRQRVVVLSSYAQRQCLEPAPQQKAGFRVRAASQNVEPLLDCTDALLRADYGPRTHVGVSVQILRRAVHHDVEADLERAKIHGSGEGIVDDRHEPVLLGERSDAAVIGYLQYRIADRFDIDRARVRLDGSAPAVGVAYVDE